MQPVSDEIVEAVARPIAIKRDCNDGRMCLAPYCSCRNIARTAIAALSSLGFGDVAKARAEGREEAAKVAENFPAHTHGALATAPAYAAEQAADEIAAAIRAMNSKKPAAG